MRTLRRRLSWLLSTWLLCQLVGLAAPVVLAAAGASPVEELCTCPGGDHETCPMHHGRSTEEGSAPVCAMTSSCAPADVALLSFAGGIGVLPAGSATFDLPQDASALLPLQTSPFDVTVPLDTPPPRF